VEERVSIQAPPDFQRRLIHFVTELLNRSWGVRDAVLEGLKRTQDSYGADAEFRVHAEAVEKLVAYFEGAVEAYREQQASGRQVVADGVGVEVVGDDEFQDLGRDGSRN